MDVCVWIAIIALKGSRAFPQVKVNSLVMLSYSKLTYHGQAMLSSLATENHPEGLDIWGLSKVHIANVHFFCHALCCTCIIKKPPIISHENTIHNLGSSLCVHWGKWGMMIFFHVKYIIYDEHLKNVLSFFEKFWRNILKIN